MDVTRMTDAESGRCLLERVSMAKGVIDQLIGLLGKAGLETGCGMFFPRCSSIHMFFMRFAIDAVYIDHEHRIKKIVSGLKPWRLSWCPGAYGVLEAPAGWAGDAALSKGVKVAFEEVAEPSQ